MLKKFKDLKQSFIKTFTETTHLNESVWSEYRDRALSESVDAGALDVKTPSVAEIAKKHDTSVDAIEAQLKKGIKVEAEHTTNASKAREIALDHLGEIPDYYDRLDNMEQKALHETSSSNVSHRSPFHIVNTKTGEVHSSHESESSAHDRLKDLHDTAKYYSHAVPQHLKVVPRREVTLKETIHEAKDAHGRHIIDDAVAKEGAAHAEHMHHTGRLHDYHVGRRVDLELSRKKSDKKLLPAARDAEDAARKPARAAVEACVAFEKKHGVHPVQAWEAHHGERWPYYRVNTGGGGPTHVKKSAAVLSESSAQKEFKKHYKLFNHYDRLAYPAPQKIVHKHLQDRNYHEKEMNRHYTNMTPKEKNQSRLYEELTERERAAHQDRVGSTLDANKASAHDKVKHAQQLHDRNTLGMMKNLVFKKKLPSGSTLKEAEIAFDESGTKTMTPIQQHRLDQKKRNAAAAAQWKSASGTKQPVIPAHPSHIKEEYKVGDHVIAKEGPHKGALHTVIHVHDTGHVNIKPVHSRGRQNRYPLGAARAHPDQVTRAPLQEDLREIRRAIRAKQDEWHTLAQKHGDTHPNTKKASRELSKLLGQQEDHYMKKWDDKLAARAAKKTMQEETLSEGKQYVPPKDHVKHLKDLGFVHAPDTQLLTQKALTSFRHPSTEHYGPVVSKFRDHGYTVSSEFKRKTGRHINLDSPDKKHIVQVSAERVGVDHGTQVDFFPPVPPLVFKEEQDIMEASKRTHYANKQQRDPAKWVQNREKLFSPPGGLTNFGKKIKQKPSFDPFKRKKGISYKHVQEAFQAAVAKKNGTTGDQDPGQAEVGAPAPQPEKKDNRPTPSKNSKKIEVKGPGVEDKFQPEPIVTPLTTLPNQAPGMKS